MWLGVWGGTRGVASASSTFPGMAAHYGGRIRVPPPAIYVVVFLVALWLEAALYRIRIVGGVERSVPLVTVGAALVTAGVLLAAWGAWTFRRHHTAVLPFQRASTLVRTGPYRYTRNPMYLGMTLAHLGGAVILNAMWPIILLPMTLVFLVRTVIRHEEEHLWKEFGEDYVQYRKAVRRWL
jgi:protein-S-isoprenylcysteine O-methyltransferase Ste14